MREGNAPATIASLDSFSGLMSPDRPLEIFLELLVIWVCVYTVFRFLRGTRGAGVVKGFLVVAIGVAVLVRVLGDATDGLVRLRFLFDRVFGLGAILIIVVFQPELRAAMSRLGRTNFFTRNKAEVGGLAREFAEAAEFLSKNRMGAIIVFERQIGMGDLVESGIKLDATPSAALIQSIFWPSSPLHDLAIVVRNGRVWAANVQLPLAQEDAVPTTLGSRHRAAVGATLDADCLVLVVSEESGLIRFAEGGQLSEPVARERVEAELTERLTRSTQNSQKDSREALPSSTMWLQPRARQRTRPRILRALPSARREPDERVGTH